MGEIADYLTEQMMEDHLLYWDEYLYNPTVIRERWYAARYKEERKMRGLTLKQVIRRAKNDNS